MSRLKQLTGAPCSRPACYAATKALASDQPADASAAAFHETIYVHTEQNCRNWCVESLGTASVFQESNAKRRPLAEARLFKGL